MDVSFPRLVLDTSAVNALHDATPDLTSRIHLRYKPVPTALQLVEIFATTDPLRRVALLRTVLDLCGDTMPLKAPNELLQQSTRAFSKRRARNLTVTIENRTHLWALMCEPERVTDESVRLEAVAYLKDMEDGFRNAHRKAREEFQAVFASDKTAQRPHSISSLLRMYDTRTNPFLYTLVGPMYKKMTGHQFQKSLLWPLFKCVPDWPIYFGSWAHEMYTRAIRAEGFSPKGKPGMVDLWSGCYMVYAHTFVTRDRGQYNALRLLRTFIEPRFRPRLLHWNQFLNTL